MPDRQGDIDKEADRMRRVSAFEAQLDSDEAKCIRSCCTIRHVLTFIFRDDMMSATCAGQMSEVRVAKRKTQTAYEVAERMPSVQAAPHQV
jgi:hypothetical protein